MAAVSVISGGLVWEVFFDGEQSRSVCEHVSDPASPEQCARVHDRHPSHL